jgi:LacI family transcriptional regulator
VSEPTIADVARRAGVSPSTVSRHLMGQKVQSAGVIDDAVQALGYRPSPIARSLRSGRTQTIAAVIPDISNPFFGSALKGAEEIARDHDYTLSVYSTDEIAQIEDVTLDRLRGRVDGLILTPAVESTLTPAELERLGVPVVLLDRDFVEDHQFDTVLVDNVGGASSAARHLLDLGHRRLGVIHGPLPSTPAQQRLDGFVQTVEEAGLDPATAITAMDGRFTQQGGHQAMLRLLSSPTPPTSVFVCNNEMTIGAVRALWELGLRVPEHLSLVGFDDHPVAALLTPAITVIDRPSYDQGALAMRLLLRRLGRAAPGARRPIVLDTSLVVRGSTAPPHPPTRPMPSA